MIGYTLNFVVTIIPYCIFETVYILIRKCHNIKNLKCIHQSPQFKHVSGQFLIIIQSGMSQNT